VTVALRPSARTSLRELFLLDPDTIYLNHGSFGATPRPVFEAYQRWQRELELQPTAYFRRAPERLHAARQALGDLVGASASDLLLVTNITVAINIVARSLALQPGDEVLATDLEYGAMDYAWQHACALAGATYVRQPVPLPVTSAAQVVEAIWAGVTPRTRVLFLSHYTSGTALRLPIEPLIARARARGILTVIDGAHAPGQLDLNLTALGAHFYGANCHKWLLTPKGCGFLYARPAVHELLQPLVVSWGYGRPDGVEPRFIAEHQYQGTRDLAPFLALPDAIAFQRDHDWAQVRAECHALLVDTRQRLQQLTGLPPLCPASADWFVQMALLPLPPCDTARLKEDLLTRFRIEIPCMAAPMPGLRLSLQGYNTPGDAAALLAALRELLAL
jgi:isopenicillin-N epimerase